MRKNIAQYALLTALAMTLSWLESMIPLPVLLPGMKAGLANLVVVFALYRLSFREAAAISLARVLLTAASFGNAYSLAYSLAGAALSLPVMAGLKRLDRFTVLGVSIAGGICHNVAQLLVAAAVLGTARLGWYLPVLLISGTLAGAAIGAAGGVVISRVR